jgi:hypothetical protein
MTEQSMIPLHLVQYTKAQLEAIPEDERVVHFILLVVANDVSMLQRSIIIHSMPNADDHDAVKAGRTATSIMLAKLLAGRLYEGWNVLRSPEHAKMRRAFESKIEPDANKAFEELGRYFGRGNLVHSLRKKVAFHLDIDTFKAAYEALPESHSFTDYHAAITGNTFYGGAADVSAVAMGRLGDAANIGEGLNRAMDEINFVSNRMMDYIGGFALAFAIAYLSLDPKKFSSNVTEVAAPRLIKARAPFFYSADATDLLEVEDAFA